MNRSYRRALITGFITSLVSGCVTLGSRPVEEGCRPIGEPSIMSYISNSTVSDEHWLFLVKEGKVYAPIGENATLTKFSSALAEESRRRGFSLRRLHQTDIVTLSPEDKKLLRGASLKSLPTPGAVTGALISIELMIDDILNRVDATIASQLFAFRAHVGATISDLNVVFRERMQDAYDKLNELERRALDNAQLLATQAKRALDDLQANGYAMASDLLCQTTVNFANYPNTVVGLGLPFTRCFAPDVLCMWPAQVRDNGIAIGEQLLSFRGISLLPNGEYPRATGLVAGRSTEMPTAGGKSVIQVPLQGGINGTPNDARLRGDLLAQITFQWPQNKVTRRWAFLLKPYSVRTVEVELIPTIRGNIYSNKDQVCSVDAPGGSLGPNERTEACAILADTDKLVERCEEVHTISQNGDSGITNHLQGPGSCEWKLRAKSKAFYGAGAWLQFLGRAVQAKTIEIPGPSFSSSAVLNQGQEGVVFNYLPDRIPDGSG